MNRRPKLKTMDAFFIFIVISLFFVAKTHSQNFIDLKLETKHIEPFTVIVDEKNVFDFNYSINAVDKLEKLENAEILVSVDDSDLSRVVGDRVIKLKEGEENGTISVILKGILSGRTKLTMEAVSENKSQSSGIWSYIVFVQREERVIDKAFTGVVILLVVLANIGMGAKVDLRVVKDTLKRPIAPAIGMCSQFIFMPLIGFFLAYTIDLEPGTALGFFALACSPGGSASNIYTNFLNGNVSLSVTMTLISSLAALGFIPLWLFTLGQVIYSQGNIKIPFSNIITTLIGIVVPVFIGLLLQHKLPKAATFFIKAVKYILVVFFIFVFTVGIYANIYVFYLISPVVILASALLPYLGFIFGGLFAFLTRQKFPDIVAIALETGIQNTGIPIILCRLSLVGPDKDTSIVSPIVSAIFTPIPIMFAILYVQGKAWLQRRRESRREIVDDTNCELNHETDLDGTKHKLMGGNDSESESY